MFCENISLQKIEAMREASGLADYHQAFQENLRRSALYWPFLVVLEVMLRNKFAVQLESRIDQDFFKIGNSIIDFRLRDALSKAQRTQRNAGALPNRDTTVASLTLGFWGMLLNKRFESTLWVPGLRYAFRGLGATSRSKIYEELNAAVLLRNRIAHHESVLTQDVEETLRKLTWLLEILEPGSSRFTSIDKPIPLHPVE